MKQKERTATIMMFQIEKETLWSPWFIQKCLSALSLNPLTAGAVHIRFLHFLLAYYISAFKPVISKICSLLTSFLSNLNNFHLLEVVDRISETQLQVGENSN